ncbi:SH3 domain-containing protein 19 isoform X2 [Clupea harengus]|uniref:SH3 domain-containing protein 19 isoform X2 n=1 Tax=Clupea harengus TaxID=7950 RepID=A0A6P8EJ65_CLUHA|nr:SH3 domain-containing protein 19 isoform X2 [Clupea harengus]
MLSVIKLELLYVVLIDDRTGQSYKCEDFGICCPTTTRNYRSERNKPDHIQPSSRPLASIRAAFKRTSGRTPSQSDHTRDRRRPEITILSAEPLASTSWFPGASGAFAPALPSTQPVWGASISVAAKVIKEKTQVQVETPVPPPRRSHTTTIATQTDTVVNSPDPECKPPTQPSSCEGSKLKRPPKPPRPSFPVKPQQAPRESSLLTAEPAANRKETKSTHTEDIGSANTVHPNTTEHPDQSPAASKSCSLELEPSEHCSISDNTVPDSSNPDPSQSSSDSPRTQAPRPVPRPRTIPSKPVSTEVKVQTLVRLKDGGDVLQLIPESSRDSPPNPYLKELLEAFGPDAPAHSSDSEGAHSELSDESGDESVDMSIRNKIKAFETQVSTDDHVNTPGPTPKPRIQNKPPMVALKPVLAPRLSVKRQTDENHNDNGNEKTSLAPKLAPTPALRPVPPKKPSIDQMEEPVAPTPKMALLPPSRPSLRNKPESFPPQEETPTAKAPPPVRTKPTRELLNNNNHNSTGLSSANRWSTEWPDLQSSSKQENESANDPIPVTANFKDAAVPAPPKPIQRAGGSFSRGGVSRKPTMIRVPSISAKSADDSQDDPPPLPVQKPVGGPPPSTQKNSFRSQESFSRSSPDLSLPPRPTGGKVLPPRPPPAKAGPGRPPPPRKEASQPPASVSSVAKGASPNLGQHQAQRSSKPSKKGPALPPRPKPGHRLYNKYTLEIPHAIAEFDCNGTKPGELSFQKNEVLVLLDQIDSKTFECQAGGVSGRVQTSYMKIITPLTAYSQHETPLNTQPEPSGNGGMQVQVLYDFIPEGQGELCLMAGDVVCEVEQLDSEWYLGTVRGARGFFPINYVKVMSTAPTTVAKALPEALSSGPRCMARFSFEAERDDELMFSEGDVIQLQEYIGEEWARGKLGTSVGIFPINFVDIIEHLPSDAGQTKIALPGMVSSQYMSSKPSQSESEQSEWAEDLPPQRASDAGQTKIALPGMVSSHKPKPSQSESEQGEWAEALYDYTAEADDDLPLRQGDRILITAHIDEEWCSGRANGREGVFPRTFVQFS